MPFLQRLRDILCCGRDLLQLPVQLPIARIDHGNDVGENQEPAPCCHNGNPQTEIFASTRNWWWWLFLLVASLGLCFPAKMCATVIQCVISRHKFSRALCVCKRPWNCHSSPTCGLSVSLAQLFQSTQDPTDSWSHLSTGATEMFPSSHCYSAFFTTLHRIPFSFPPFNPFVFFRSCPSPWARSAMGQPQEKPL